MVVNEQVKIRNDTTTEQTCSLIDPIIFVY